GRKSALSDLLGGMGRLAPEERRAVGSAANLVKRALEQAFAERESVVRQRELAQALERERIDVTLPGRPPALGALHPITQTLDECVEVLRGLGFQLTQTPEVETDYYNFEALNMPNWHPARENQVTLLVLPDLVLRMQTN